MIAAMNINNVRNSISNIHDLSLNVSDLCWLANGGI